jgi:hypothetical protein
MKSIFLIGLLIGITEAFSVSFGGTKILTTTSDEQILTIVDSIELAPDINEFIDGIYTDIDYRIQQLREEAHTVIAQIRQEINEILGKAVVYAGLGLGGLVLVQVSIGYILFRKLKS